MPKSITFNEDLRVRTIYMRKKLQLRNCRLASTTGNIHRAALGKRIHGFTKILGRLPRSQSYSAQDLTKLIRILSYWSAGLHEAPRLPLWRMRVVMFRATHKIYFASTLTRMQQRIEALQKKCSMRNHKSKKNGGIVESEAWQRKQWKIGSKVEVYSNYSQTWAEGDILRIFNDAEGDLLMVQYVVNGMMRLKPIRRDDEAVIRPLSFGTAAASAVPMPTSVSREDVEMQIRKSWVRGSYIDVYCWRRKQWMRGLVTYVFENLDGESLEVRYGENTKEVHRFSSGIRPLSVRATIPISESVRLNLKDAYEIAKARELAKVLWPSLLRGWNNSKSDFVHVPDELHAACLSGGIFIVSAFVNTVADTEGARLPDGVLRIIVLYFAFSKPEALAVRGGRRNALASIDLSGL